MIPLSQEQKDYINNLKGVESLHTNGDYIEMIISQPPDDLLKMFASCQIVVNPVINLSKGFDAAPDIIVINISKANSYHRAFTDISQYDMEQWNKLQTEFAEQVKDIKIEPCQGIPLPVEFNRGDNPPAE